MKQGRWQKNISSYPGRLFVGLMLSVVALFADAAGSPVYLLLSGERSYYQEVSAVFQKALAEQHNAPIVHVYGLDQALQVAPNSTVVAVGSKASELALRRFPNDDIVSLLMPVAAWDELCLRLPGAGRRAAVVIDQPLERSLALGKLLVPSAKRVGAVFGPISVASKPQLRSAVQRSGMELIYADLTSDDNPIGVLTPLVQKTDLFITVADRAVFNKSVAKWLLYLSFRQKVSVIGFSQSYAKAGALAAVYSSPENIGRHGAELFALLLSSEEGAPIAAENWRAHYPKYYTLEVNREVARALNITVPELNSLYKEFHSVLETMQ
ncbi:MAG: ABC transporter substrate-binding protein [Candidatus Reddybacter sp.]